VYFHTFGYRDGFRPERNTELLSNAAYNSAVGCSITATTGTWSRADVFSGAAKLVTGDNYVEVMGSTVKVSNSQSLFASTSLVTGLYTNTLVTTKPSKTSGGTNTSTATATGGVYLRAVLLDAPNGNPIMYGYPAAACNAAVLGCSGTGSDSGVVLDSRVQTLTQSLSDCVVNATVSSLAGTGTCDFTSTIQLILQTTSAHGYNFIFPNIGVGSGYLLLVYSGCCRLRCRCQHRHGICSGRRCLRPRLGDNRERQDGSQLLLLGWSTHAALTGTGAGAPVSLSESACCPCHLTSVAGSAFPLPCLGDANHMKDREQRH